jgi:hypothetical protein
LARQAAQQTRIRDVVSIACYRSTRSAQIARRVELAAVEALAQASPGNEIDLSRDRNLEVPSITNPDANQVAGASGDLTRVNLPARDRNAGGSVSSGLFPWEPQPIAVGKIRGNEAEKSAITVADGGAVDGHVPAEMVQVDVTGAPSVNPLARCLAVADKLFICSRSENYWHGENLHTKDGDLFDGVGTLWNCNERLCPSCLAARARRARSSARLAVMRPAPREGQLWRFVTLTMPTLPAARSPLLNTLHVVARAWRLFSKREWWRNTVRAGVKGVEFTMGNPVGKEWNADEHGYHVHLHLLVLSSWVEWRRLRSEWSDCLKLTWAEFGIDQGINTKDGMAVCDVRLVTNRQAKKRGTGIISAEAAINEVAKYLTKSESWDKIPESQLVEVASLERWPRMFELLGECRAPAKPRPVTSVPAVASPDETVTVDERLAALHDEGTKQSMALWLQARAEMGVLLSLQKETLDLINHSTAYLDTPNVSGGSQARDGPIYRRRRGGRSLREVGAELIGAGGRQIWKETLAMLVGERRSFRRSFQVRTYPLATFRDLVGRTWYGLAANPACAR